MNSDERLDHWFAEGDNADEWARMREALSLSEGFALLFAVVPDGVTESLVADLVEVEAASDNRRIVTADAALAGDDSAVRGFLGVEANERVLLVLRTAQASRRNVEALERCLVQLNGRRDQIAARVRGPIIVLMRADTIRRVLDIAPDLYSVHAAQFRFVGMREPSEAPPWLLTSFEAIGVLGTDPGHIRLARTIRDLTTLADPPTIDTLCQAAAHPWDHDATPIQHLVWSALAWLFIHRHQQAEAREALSQAETAGRAWAVPFAFLRIRLLHIEHAIVTGDILAAAVLFEPILDLPEELLDPAHEVSTAVLARGVEIFDGSDRPERAKQLADECWRQLQYADTVREQTLITVAHVYAEHGPATRLQAIQTRWTQCFPDRPWPLSARQAQA